MQRCPDVGGSPLIWARLVALVSIVDVVMPWYAVAHSGRRASLLSGFPSEQ